MYTSTLWASCLYQRVFVSTLPVWTGSPSGRRRFQWRRFQQRPWPRLSTLFESPNSVLLRLTTDQGTQFEASLFHALSQLLGTERQHTTPYHPAANGQIERFHRQLKVVIMTHGNSGS
ncbi:integrase catalytic domain-containing protein [Trichonephila inaurata madagascariensis]|uniref:Integrase catalytic domain-containing protein n=1 Tax=Trichonephila inaurata madagascariensis TaxID=2747483 RepID=A0A8X6XBU6_9ARAC|nr:integrase catalytic domain-containing protein [Trichonephila inaurata madagascariensis]